MKAHLVLCPSCARHVRVSEVACPFCEAQLPSELRASAPPKRTAGRLSRAALFALGTTTATAAASTGLLACDDETTPTPTGVDSGGDGQSNAVYGAPADAGPLVDAAYGGPPIDSGAPLLDAAYGGPPQDASDQ